jgi:NAD(P)-dependent dehydrogenase (short-subunit alcohol dehydrogenase family)
MTDRAAIVTGGSSGIGYAIAQMLGEEGYALTISGRRADKLEAAARELAAAGHEVQHIAGNVAEEDVVRQVVDAHRERYARLDMLVNNAGVGIGAPVGEIQTKRLDLQVGVNLRSLVLFYRDAVDMLRAAGAEHGNAIVVNTSSIAGKSGQAWMSVYSATKHAVIGFTQAMNKELLPEGIKSCALCPAFVATPMTEFIQQSIPAQDMITPQDVAEGVRLLLRVSPACVIPELVFERRGASAQTDG